MRAIRSRHWIVLYALSPREHFVCQGLTQRLTYKEIASVLDVTTSTVRSQAQSAMDKLGAADHLALASIYEHACAIARLSSNGLAEQVIRATTAY